MQKVEEFDMSSAAMQEIPPDETNDSVKVYKRIKILNVGTVGTACYKGTDEEPWNLSLLQQAGDEKKDPILIRNLGRIARQDKVRTVYAPRANTFTATILSDKTLLTHTIPLGGGRNLRRHTGYPAEGVFLDRGEAYAVRAAGCAVIVAYGGGQCLAAHAGRWSVLDLLHIKTSTRGREYLSVVDACVAAFKTLGIATLDWVTVRFAIHPSDFTHSGVEYRDFNQRMFEYIEHRFGARCVYWKDEVLHLDLVEIIAAQFAGYGVEVDLTDPYLPDGFPHTYNSRPEHPRNLIFVSRT